MIDAKNPCPIGENSCLDCRFEDKRSCTWGRRKNEEIFAPEEYPGLETVRRIVRRWLDDGEPGGYGEGQL